MKDDARVTEYYTTMVGVGLFPLTLRITRVFQANATLIDHIWSTIADKNVVSGVVHCDLSDHYALFANFPLNLVLEVEKKDFQTSPYAEVLPVFRAELKGTDPFENMIFYLWTDSNEICTEYVKLKINHILFVKNFWFSI